MLVRHKNILGQVAQDSGVAFSFFEAAETHRGELTIKVLDTPLLFKIWQHPFDFNRFEFHYSLYQPDFPLFEQRGYWDIEKISCEFGEWIDRTVKRYLEDHAQPDLWAKVEILRSLINTSTFVPAQETQFSQEETQVIQDALRKFGQLLMEQIALTQEEINYVKRKLIELSEWAVTLPSIAWKEIVLSTLISIIITLSVDTETGRMIFQLFQEAFGTAINLLSHGFHLNP